MLVLLDETMGTTFECKLFLLSTMHTVQRFHSRRRLQSSSTGTAQLDPEDANVSFSFYYFGCWRGGYTCFRYCVRQRSARPDVVPTRATNGLCDKCNNAQELILQRVASFEASNEVVSGSQAYTGDAEFRKHGLTNSKTINIV